MYSGQNNGKQKLYLDILYFQLLLLFITNSQAVVIDTPLPNIKAAVLVPGFLAGDDDFGTLEDTLESFGIPTVIVPMKSWHWIPCLGGRSLRPVLDRLDSSVRHVAAGLKPVCKYTWKDAIGDFFDNPGGILRVGGTDEIDKYPNVIPRGYFPIPDKDPIGKIALIGHSAGGWISRIYLSDRNYAGKVYSGHQYVHSLVTLGSPHLTGLGPAFASLEWCNRIKEHNNYRKLAVGGIGYLGNEWGALTQGSYAFCCPHGTDGKQYDGDGVTPIQSSLGWDGADTITLDGVSHFCWSDYKFTLASRFFAPELTTEHSKGKPWYGSKEIVKEWVPWLLDC